MDCGAQPVKEHILSLPEDITTLYNDIITYICETNMAFGDAGRMTITCNDKESPIGWEVVEWTQSPAFITGCQRMYKYVRILK